MSMDPVILAGLSPRALIIAKNVLGAFAMINAGSPRQQVGPTGPGIAGGQSRLNDIRSDGLNDTFGADVEG